LAKIDHAIIQAISNKINVLNEFAWKGICKVLFNGNSFRNDTFDGLRVGTALQMAEKETGEVSVYTLSRLLEKVR
jgi:hypothetical protein